jgi:hypothetical protein
VAQLGARLDGIEEVVGSNPIGSTKLPVSIFLTQTKKNQFCGNPLIVGTWGTAVLRPYMFVAGIG